MWEKYIGSKIKVIQTDGWIKYGMCVGSENKFLLLKFKDNRVVSLSSDIIASVEPQGGASNEQ